MAIAYSPKGFGDLPYSTIVTSVQDSNGPGQGLAAGIHVVSFIDPLQTRNQGSGRYTSYAMRLFTEVNHASQLRHEDDTYDFDAVLKRVM